MRLLLVERDKMQFNKLEQLKQKIEYVLHCAKQEGASAVEVHAVVEDGFAVTVRNGELDTVEYHCDNGVGIDVYFGKKHGIVSTADMSESALREVVIAACNIAKFTQEDPCNGLADKELMAKKIEDLDVYHDWEIDSEQAIKIALENEAYARSLDQRIKNSEGVSISSHKNFYVYGNSYGFVGAVPSTRHSASYALIAEQNGEMERDCDYTVSCDAQSLENFRSVAKKTVEKTVARLGATKIATQKRPVIFAAEIAKGLLASFVAAISGNNLYRKASFLVDHLHKPVFAKQVRIFEDPWIKKSLNSSYFDAEGVATCKKDFVKEGVLQSYVLGSYSACKLGMQTTANAGGVFNLFIQDDGLDLPGLLKKMDTGVLITELSGQGINLVTGDYSRGAVGFWVEHGEIQHPVSEITIAGNLRDMFMNLVAVGNDIDYRGNIKSGSILLEEMTVAGH
jgi:PmbA protein